MIFLMDQRARLEEKESHSGEVKMCLIFAESGAEQRGVFLGRLYAEAGPSRAPQDACNHPLRVRGGNPDDERGDRETKQRLTGRGEKPKRMDRSRSFYCTHKP